MDLKRTTRKNTQFIGQESFELSGSKTLKILSAGQEILKEKCPVGYKWNVEVSVHVTQLEVE